MLHDNNLIEMSLRRIRSEPLITRYWKKTWDKKRYTITKELTINFHDRTAKANKNFYI